MLKPSRLAFSLVAILAGDQPHGTEFTLAVNKKAISGLPSPVCVSSGCGLLTPDAAQGAGPPPSPCIRNRETEGHYLLSLECHFSQCSATLQGDHTAHGGGLSCYLQNYLQLGRVNSPHHRTQEEISAMRRRATTSPSHLDPKPKNGCSCLS